MTTHTLTTSYAALNIKSGLVLFKGNDSTIYLDAHPGGVLCWTDVYSDGLIKHRSGFTVGDQTGVRVWTSQCSISSTGNFATNGSISATGAISGGSITSTGAISGGPITSSGSLVVTGTSGRPTAPTVQGCFIGGQSGGHIAIELTASVGFDHIYMLTNLMPILKDILGITIQIMILHYMLMQP